MEPQLRSYSKKIVKPEQGDAELLEAARAVPKWNLSREVTFIVPDDLWPLIMEQGKKLEEVYGCEDIPLLLRANPYKLSVLAYAFALLEGYVAPEKRHVKLAYKWLDFCAKDIELDKYVEWWRSQHILEEKEYHTLVKRLEDEMKKDVDVHGGSIDESYLYKIVEYLAKNEKGQRDEVAAYLDVEPQTVSVKARFLKGLGLLRSDKNGYRFTAKGVRFFKRWLQQRASLTHLTHHTGFNGQTHSEDEKKTRKEALTPESGKISKMGNREPIISVVLSGEKLGISSKCSNS